MNTNYELLQFYIYKKLIRKKDADDILAECKRLNTGVRDYLLAKEYITEATELEALAEYYCMPYVEIDMLEIDKSLFDLFTFEFMKRFYYARHFYAHRLGDVANARATSIFY